MQPTQSTTTSQEQLVKVTLQLFVYGSSDKTLKVEIVNHSQTQVQEIAASVIANAGCYLVYKLGLPREHVYYLFKSETDSFFDYINNLKPDTLVIKGSTCNVLILYSEVDVVKNKELQRFIVGLFAQIFPSTQVSASQPRSLAAEREEAIEEYVEAEQEFSKTLSKREVVMMTSRTNSTRYVKLPTLITDGVATQPIGKTKHGLPCYCHAPNTLPFSYVKSKIKQGEKEFESPTYLTQEEIDKRFNSRSGCSVDELHKGMYERNSKNELVMINKELNKQMSGIFPDVLKQIALLVFTGQSVFKVQLPIRIFDTKSQVMGMLEFLTNLDQLRLASEATNSLERFKRVITYAVSNFAYRLFILKPYNPLLGETFEGVFTDGTLAYCEHVVHEPPAQHILLVNEQIGFRVYATLRMDVKFSASEGKFMFKGVIVCDFKGDKFYYTFPHYVNRGMLTGQRRLSLEGTMYFHYPARNWKAFVHLDHGKLDGAICINDDVLDPKHASLTTSLFADPKHMLPPSDQILSTITGSWLNNVNFDGVEYWNRSEKSHVLHVANNVIPSDFRWREDLISHLRGNSEEALLWKLRLEEVQREDRKRREKYEKKHNINSNREH